VTSEPRAGAAARPLTREAALAEAQAWPSRTFDAWAVLRHSGAPGGAWRMVDRPLHRDKPGQSARRRAERLYERHRHGLRRGAVALYGYDDGAPAIVRYDTAETAHERWSVAGAEIGHGA